MGSLEISGNTSGRVNNKGMEGVAITPDGKTLVGIMQSPLIQDGGLSSINVRIVVYDLTNPTAAPKQYLYQLDSPTPANSEILAISNHSFLVDERDATVGSGNKLLYKIDFNQTTAPTDLAASAFPGTTADNGMKATLTSTPAGVVPLTKTLFANVGALVAPGLNTDSTKFRTDLPDKFEGYCWGPDLPDGRHLLLATNDNDYAQRFDTAGGAITGKGFPNYIFAMAVDPSDVPEFQAATFDPLAGLDSIQHIVVVYQENWSFDALYGSFPGANGIPGSGLPNQIDRLTGAALSTENGANTFNRLSQTGNTPNLPLVNSGNTNSNPGTLNNPPQPLGSPTGASVVDTRFSSNPADATSTLNVNTLSPYALPTFVAPTALTGDIVHRYWHEQFQIFGSNQVGGADNEAGNNQSFVTWSDNPGLVMSHFDGTNLPEGLFAQQYTLCDNYYHSAFGGSFLNHQFLVAAQAPAYDNMPTSNNGNIAYLDANGYLVLNTSGPSQGKQAQDGSITPVAGDQLTITLNGTGGTAVTVGSGANQGYAEAYAGTAGTVFTKHYVVNTTRSVNLPSGTDAFPSISLLPSLNDSNPSDSTRTYELNIGDSLSAANVSWKWYSGGWAQIAGYSTAYPAGTPTINPLYPKITDGQYASNNAANQYQYHHQPIAYFDNYAPFGAATVPAAYVGGFAGVLPSGVNPGDHGTTINQATNSAAHLQDEVNFFADVASGNLPAVSFIKPVGINNEHPGYATLQAGQAHVSSIIQAIQANPALWAHTMVIITYDEHGGRWDHVTPPTRDIWGPGVRVPAVIISPLAKQGFVDHTQRDTSSILSTIEERFGLASLNTLDGNAPSFATVLSPLAIVRGSYIANNRAHTITQPVTITNQGSTAITGPIQVVLDNLTSGVTLQNSGGTTSVNLPASPYITVTTGTLAPGASATVTLLFNMPASGGVSYTARTVTGTATP
jgi:acid phosphatase